MSFAHIQSSIVQPECIYPSMGTPWNMMDRFEFVSVTPFKNKWFSLYHHPRYTGLYPARNLKPVWDMWLDHFYLCSEVFLKYITLPEINIAPENGWLGG